MTTILELIAGNFKTCIVLLQMVCVIMVVTYLIMRSRFFEDFQIGRLTWKSTLLMILLFGSVSIYGTESGIFIFGAQINIRDLGPMAGGLTCGPLVGIGAGLIGGFYRYAIGGGITLLAGVSATILAGILSGLIYLFNKKRFIGIKGAVLFTGIMELIHMGIVLLISRPFDQALQVVETVAIPMSLANMFGMAVFSFIYQNLKDEIEMKDERDKIRSDLERKQAELNIARDIQLSFLPETIPQIQGYDVSPISLPAREVGGDFYDIIVPISQDKIGILIADVSGKGVPAALFMALSRTITRANATWHKSAVTVISETNSMICADSRSGMFVTLFFGVLNPVDGVFTYVNAGHNPPVIYRTDKSQEELNLTGPALGIIDDAFYTEGVTRMDAGDILLMYTDGVTEAVNSKNDEFGTEKLNNVIHSAKQGSAEEIRDAIVDEIRVHSEGQEQFDDITIIVMKADAGNLKTG